jgi:protein-L-isoaspartate(D-aspartate) O-methyltransferase
MLTITKIQNFFTGNQKNIPLAPTIRIYRKSESTQRSQVPVVPAPSLPRIFIISLLGYCTCWILFFGKIKACHAAINDIRTATLGADNIKPVFAKGSVLSFLGSGFANKRSYYQKEYYQGTKPPFVTNESLIKFFKSCKYNSATTTAMKAWSCHGRNQQDMVYRLHQAGIIRSEEVYRVMSMVDRKNYFPSTSSGSSINNNNNNANYYYEDAPNSIGYGQTISAPHMHAYVLEEIISHLRTNINSPYYNLIMNKNSQSLIQFLDVGCGSGYITACFGRWLQSPSSTTTINNNENNNNSRKSILGLKGYTYGIDIVPELVKLSTDNIMKQDSDLFNAPLLSRFDDDDNNNQNNTSHQSIVSLQVGNGYQGLKEYAPYDIIHVGAAASTLPKELCQQLKVGGLLIVPIDDNNDDNNMNMDRMIYTKSQTLYKIERLSDKNNATTTTTTTDTNTVSLFDPTEFRKTALLGVRYVPLVQDRLKS